MQISRQMPLLAHLKEEDDDDEEDDSSEGGYTMEEVAKHNKRRVAWEVLNWSRLECFKFPVSAL